MEINKGNATLKVEVRHEEVSIQYSDEVFEGGVSFPIEDWQQVKGYIDKKIINSMGVKSDLLGNRDEV